MGEEIQRFPRNKGSDGTHGIDFEWETTLLAYLKCVAEHEEWKRTKISGLKSFFVANNVNGVGAFDDVVVRKEIVRDGKTTTKLTFTQCKHVAEKKSDLKKGGKYLSKNEIQKYFESFIKVYKVFLQEDVPLLYLDAQGKKTIDDKNEIALRLQLKNMFNCDFSDCEFMFVSNIDSLSEEFFELISSSSGDYVSKTSNFDTRINRVENEYRLRSDRCFKFLECKEFCGMEKQLILEFCKMFRIFSITNNNNRLEIDDMLSKLCKEEFKSNACKKIMRDTLLEETKLSFKESVALNEQINMFENIKEFLSLKKLSDNRINSYNEIIPMKMDEACEKIKNIQINNQTEYLRLVTLRIYQSLFYLHQDYFCIIVRNEHDSRKFELSRSTFKYRREAKVFVFFDKFCSTLEKEEMNEQFIKLSHKFENQPSSTLFQQLSRDEVNVIENAKILFQGYEIALKEICSNWKEFLDEDAICNILESQQLVVGTELPIQPNLYIKRKLKIKVLGVEIKNLITSLVQSGRKKGNEKFFLFLQNDRNAERFNERRSSKINNSCKYIQNIEEARSELSEVITKKAVSFYLVTCNSDKYELRYTFRNDRKCLEDRIVDEEFLITECSCEKITFLSDKAGMGKSTTMLNLAVEYKKFNKSHWVYYIQLGKYSTDFEKAKTLLKPSTSINFLASKILKLAGVDFNFFTDACSATGNVAIFFDGYDELSQKAKEVFLRYLLALEETKIHKIFVSSRQNVIRDLEMLTLQNSIEFIEFNSIDKENCLLEIWKQKLAETGDNVESEKLKTIADIIIKDTESERNSIKEILAIPLQIKMFAFAYYEKMLECCKINADFSIQFDILHLYKNFVVSQVSHYHAKSIPEWDVMHEDKRKKYIRNKLIGVHEFVCSLIVPNMVRNKIEDTKYIVENLRDDLGLITDDSQTPPLFVHKTIAEYLAAEFIVNKFLSQANDEESEKMFESLLTDDEFDIFRIFINSLLDEKKFPAFFKPNPKEVTIEFVEERTPFHVAALEGNLTLVKALLQRRESFINLRDDVGFTALHFASFGNKIEIAKFLLSHGCSAVERDINGNISLQIAAEEGNTEIVEMLINHDASLLNMRDNAGHTSLHYASLKNNIECVKTLLSHGCSAVERNINGNIALQIAAEEGNTEIVEMLLTHDASLLNMQSNNGHTSLHYASWKNNIECVKILLSHGCSAVERNEYGATALHTAAEEGNTEIVEMLLTHDASLINMQDNYGITSLHFASLGNNIECVKILLSHGCSVVERDKVGNTALQIAAERGNPEIVEMLLTHDASLLNMQNNNGHTSLHHASLRNNIECVKILLSHGCSVVERDEDGNTALHYAAEQGNTEIMEILLNRDTSLQNSRNNHGETPLQKAICSFHISAIKFLLNYGCSVSNRDNDGDTVFNDAAILNNVEAMELLLQYDKSLLNGQNNKGDTPLQQACQEGNAEAVNFILEYMEQSSISHNCEDHTTFH